MLLLPKTHLEYGGDNFTKVKCKANEEVLIDYTNYQNINILRNYSLFLFNSKFT